MQPTAPKYSLLAVILLGLSLLASGNEAEKNHHLKGPVKSYLAREYNVQNNGSSWRKGDHCFSRSYSITRFDKKGRCVEVSQVLEDSQQLFVVSKTVTTYNGDVKHERTYDQNGTLVGELCLAPISASEWSYAIKMPNDGEACGTKTVATTDSTTITTTTGQKNNKTYTLVTTSKAWVDGAYKYSQSVFDNGPDAYSITLLAKVDTLSQLVVEQTTTYSNDQSDYRRFTYTKFDKHNNWTERLAFTAKEDSEPSYIEIREIEYH